MLKDKQKIFIQISVLSGRKGFEIINDLNITFGDGALSKSQIYKLIEKYKNIKNPLFQKLPEKKF